MKQACNFFVGGLARSRRPPKMPILWAHPCARWPERLAGLVQTFRNLAGIKRLLNDSIGVIILVSDMSESPHPAWP